MQMARHERLLVHYWYLLAMCAYILIGMIIWWQAFDENFYTSIAPFGEDIGNNDNDYVTADVVETILFLDETRDRTNRPLDTSIVERNHFFRKEPQSRMKLMKSLQDTDKENLLECAQMCVLPGTMRVTVVFGTMSYMEVVANWLLVYHRVTRERSGVLLVVYDQQSYERALQLDLPAVHFHRSKITIAKSPVDQQTRMTTTGLWRNRVETLNTLIQANYTVLMSDADALWIRDPWPWLEFFHSVHGTEVVASRGSFPPSVFKKYGLTACMGFTAFFQSDDTRWLVSQMLEGMHGSMKDDQVALNTVLGNVNLFFEDGETLQSRRESTGVSVAQGTERRPGLRVAFLPSRKVVRICNDIQDYYRDKDSIVILHCFVEKIGESKRKWIINYGQWLFREYVFFADQKERFINSKQ